MADSKVGLIKSMVANVLELFSIRLELARLDTVSMLQDMVKIGLYALIAVFLFIAAFVSLLFGLDALLSPVAKLWVFFGFAVLLLVLVVYLLLRIRSLINAQGNFLADSVQGFREDLSFVRGERQFEDLNFSEWLDDK